MRVSQEKVDDLLAFAERKISDLEIYYKDEKIPVFWIRFLFFFVGIVGFFNRGFKKRWESSISNGLGGRYLIFPSRKTHSDLRDYRVYKIFRHELVHLIDQRKRPIWFNLTYALLPLPILLSGRSHWEFRGYAQNLIVRFEEFGYIDDSYLEWIADQFTGSLYLWMYPFRGSLMKKLRRLREAIVSGDVSGKYPDLKFFG